MLQLGNFIQQRIAFFLKGGLFVFTHGTICLITDKFILPFVQHLAADTNFLSDLTGRLGPGTKLSDCLTFYLCIKGSIMILYKGDEPLFARVKLVQPAIQQPVTGIPQALLRRKPGSSPLLFTGVAGFSRNRLR